MSISISFNDVTSINATFRRNEANNYAWLDLELTMKPAFGETRDRVETIILFAANAQGFAAAQMEELCGTIQRQTCEENPLPRIVNPEPDFDYTD